MKARLVVFLIVLTGLNSCIKDPAYPIEPIITFKSIATINSVIYMNNGQAIYIPDTITLGFTDGDGDLGASYNGIDSCDYCGLKKNDTSCLRLNNFNVFVLDSRDSCLDTYKTAEIQTGAKSRGVSGEVVILHRIRPKDPSCFVPSTSCPKEILKLKIRIKDKAGHLSNEVETPQITLEVKDI